MFISVITLHELEYGVLLMERSDSRRGALLREWLDHSVMEAFVDRVLPVDEGVARRAAGLHDAAPFRDGFIAATAMVHRMSVVTRSGKDFHRFPQLPVVNPWGP